MAVVADPGEPASREETASLIAEAKEKHMSSRQGRNPANETQANPQDKVQAGMCANCGMKQDEWRTRQGYQMDGETFCCEGCATGTGCTC